MVIDWDYVMGDSQAGDYERTRTSRRPRAGKCLIGKELKISHNRLD